MKQLFTTLVLLCFSLPSWADADLDPSFRLHTWGPEVDLAWHPIALIPHTQTTFFLGGEALYKPWNYFHDPISGNALTAAKLVDASVKELSGSWFLGMAQGLVGQQAASGPDRRAWDSPDLVEVYGNYRGSVLRTLSSGSNLANSSQPDKDGYVQTLFMGGLDLNLLTKADNHNLKSGFLLEGAAETAPVGLQSVNVDFNRVTALWTGFLPVFDADPESRLNTFSVLFGANLVWDHLWGSTIPAQARQLIGGRSWDGPLGYVEGLGGVVRGIETGRFDGTDKVVGNLDLRFNLPGLDFPDFVRSLSPFDLQGSMIPGVLLFYDYGAWSGLSGILPGSVTTAGVGVFLTIGPYGSLALYNEYWLTGGSPYEAQNFLWTASLGMQF